MTGEREPGANLPSETTPIQEPRGGDGGEPFAFHVNMGSSNKAFLPFAIVLFLISCAMMGVFAALGLVGGAVGALLGLGRGRSANKNRAFGRKPFFSERLDNSDVIDVTAVEIDSAPVADDDNDAPPPK